MGSIYTINAAVCAQRCLSFICDAVRSYCETLSEVLSGCRERAAFDWLERDGHRSCCSVLRRSGFSRPPTIPAVRRRLFASLSLLCDGE